MMGSATSGESRLGANPWAYAYVAALQLCTGAVFALLIGPFAAWFFGAWLPLTMLFGLRWRRVHFGGSGT